LIGNRFNGQDALVDSKIKMLEANGYLLDADSEGDYIKISPNNEKYTVSKIEIDYNPIEWIQKKIDYHLVIIESL
jgi:hypothetical protein